MMDGWGPGGYGAIGIIGWIFMMAVMVAVVVGVIFLIVWLVRQASWPGYAAGGGGAHAAPRGETALDILKMRYAKGEIDRDEFEEKKKALGG